MENLEKKMRLSALYDIYKNLLTEKQRKYFEEYYFLDLSLSEVSLNYDVSKAAVFDQVKKIENNLEEYESNLHLLEKEMKLEELLSHYDDSDNLEVKKLIEEIRNLE